MCMACYEDYGSPRINNSKVRDAVAAIRLVYEFSCVGGNLHILIDDWNLDDETIEFCEGAIKENVHEADSEWLEAERKCLEILKGMTLDERASARAIQCGFFVPGGFFSPDEDPL